MSRFTALVVEDDILQREAIADVLKNQELEVVECSTAEAAELIVVSIGTELLVMITDISLGGDMSGLQLAECQAKIPPSPGHHDLGRDPTLHSPGHHVSAEAIPCQAIAGRRPGLGTTGSLIR